MQSKNLITNYHLRITSFIQFSFYALVLLTPLLMSAKTTEIFEFNKMMFIYCIAIVTGTVWGIHYFLTEPKKIYKPWLVIPLLIFLIIQIISAVFSIDPHTSIFGYYGRWNGGVISIIAYLVLFFVFVQIATKRFIIKLLQLSVISSSVVMIWGLLAKFGVDFSCLIFTKTISNSCWTDQFKPAERMFSTIGQPNWLGAYLGIHFFIGVYFFVKEYFTEAKSRANAFVYAGYALLTILCIYFTRSRSSQLAVAGAFIFAALIILIKKFRIPQQAIFILMSAILLFAGVFFLSPSYLKVPLPQTPEGTISDSFEIRKIVWRGAIDLGLQYPLFGSGAETFAYAYYFTRPNEHNRTSEWDFIYNKAHNEYLNYFATTGFIGLTSYLLLIASVFAIFFQYYKKYLKKDELIPQSLTFYLFPAYMTILVTNYFGFSTSTIQIFFYLIPALMITDLGWNSIEHHPEASWHSVHMLQKAAVLSVAIIGVGSMIYLSRYYRADLKYNSAKTYISEAEYGKATVELYDALKLKNEHVYEDKLSNTLGYLAFEYSFDDKKQAEEFIMLSKISNYKTLAAAPKNMLYWKTRSRNYYLYYQVTHDIKDLEESSKSMEKAISIAPTDVQTYHALTVLYISLSQEYKDPKVIESYKKKARATLDTIFKMKPNYREAQELGGQI